MINQPHLATAFAAPGVEPRWTSSARDWGFAQGK